MYKIYLQNILTISEDKQRAVLDIRNSTFVNSGMYTDHKISLEEHLSWLKNLVYKSNHCVFAVLKDQEVFGIVSLNNIKNKKKETDWAFYIKKTNIIGLGPALEYAFINYIFETNKFTKLNCEVLETNETVLRLHKKFYFKEVNKTNFIKKKDKNIKIIYLSLNSFTWSKKKKLIYEKYIRVFKNFSINFEQLNEKYKSQ